MKKKLQLQRWKYVLKKKTTATKAEIRIEKKLQLQRRKYVLKKTTATKAEIRIEKNVSILNRAVPTRTESKMLQLWTLLFLK